MTTHSHVPHHTAHDVADAVNICNAGHEFHLQWTIKDFIAYNSLKIFQ
jgi:hypothetical protein